MLWLSAVALLSVDSAVVLMPAPSLGYDLGCASTGAAGGQPLPLACGEVGSCGFCSVVIFGVVEEFQARERDVGAIKTSAPLTSRPTRNENALPKISVQLAIALDFWT